MPSTSSLPDTVASANDLAALAALRAKMGDDLVKEVLGTELARVDDLCEKLQAATRCSEWQDSARLALEIAARAGGLGFRRVTNAARSFAAATEAKLDPHMLRNGAQMVVFEHERLRLGIELQFPELLV